ncbi:MAG: DUF1592 domain-containing protein [Aureliella sp.]
MAETRLPDNAATVLLEENCFDCHSGDEAEGGMDLDQLVASLDQHSEQNAKMWWKVLKNFRAGTMPPPDSGYQIDAADGKLLQEWLKFSAMRIDRQDPNPGSVTLRRLNRREYAATIRDLMGVDFNADIVFPPDDTGFGFDTVGDVLGFSPMAIEKYLASAKQIVDRAVPRQTTVIPEPVDISKIKNKKGKSAHGLPMDEPADVSLDFKIERTDEYRVQVHLQTGGSFEYCSDRCELVVKLDEEEIHKSTYGWDADRDWLIEIVRPLTAGKHHVEMHMRPSAPAKSTDDEPDYAKSYLGIEQFVVLGPTNEQLWDNPPGYQKFFHRRRLPDSPDDLRLYAQEVLERFALKAFRRPPEDATVQRLVKIAELVYETDGKTFEDGVAAAMMSVLASPRFLLRFEAAKPSESSEQNSGSQYPIIDDYSLASRLSYFLWSSMPDDELFALCEAGTLRNSLDEQLDRMLRDPKAEALIEGFGSQWLRTGDVEGIQIDSLAAYGLREKYDTLTEEYVELREIDEPSEEVKERIAELRSERGKMQKYRKMFDAATRRAMRMETESLLRHVVMQRRPLSELLDPGYTFLNNSLSNFYRIEGVDPVKGSEMKRVDLPADSPRGGILTQGTMLAVTSNPTRTSPVKRGLFVLENILGTPTPPAPPNVPELEQSKDRFGGREPTLRELLAVHRESALCSSCHSRMDPLGLALENYNALGKWRTDELGQPIKPAGQLITGEKFESVVELRKILANERKADFYRCVTQKLFTYALGRGVEYYDEPTCDAIVDELLAGNDDFMTLISRIVHSPAFQRQTE